jgi:hypothetical protein
MDLWYLFVAALTVGMGFRLGALAADGLADLCTVTIVWSFERSSEKPIHRA